MADKLAISILTLFLLLFALILLFAKNDIGGAMYITSLAAVGFFAFKAGERFG